MRRLSLPLAALLIGALGWVALTTLATGSAIANWAPCPRNWGWLPSYMPRESPLESHGFKIGKARVKICYGSPALGGRKMLGGVAVPYGKLWRTGANEPTTLHLDHVLRVGDLVLAAGSYSIYTIPGERDWTVIFNRSTQQWGLESAYTDEVAEQEVGRMLVRARTLDTPLENLRFTSAPSATAAVDLFLEWQRTQIRIPFDSGFAAPDPDDLPRDSGPD
ncbi:MAG: DUF2911 domain-containing protein [Thermoanaerobaculia bacterium]|jgi:hypothetical protein|nr:DUF2911 domain-containing protein [Thermoanaerobaculia bacterium]MBP9822847.1 DUF2911 domain-containing protein [Thermoanaerobaculia bacterium]